MPKAKAKTKQNTDDGSDDDYGGTQASQATQSMTQAERALSGMSPDELDRKVNDLVKFLLIMDQKKVPIKRLDISKIVLKEHAKAFPLMMKKAEEKLAQVFGIDIVEVEGKQKSYILVNKIESDTDNPHLKWPPEDNSRIALVMIILSIIFMNGNVVNDSLLWHALKKMGIEPDDRAHKVFGDVKKLITSEFVKQGYLEYIRQPNTEPPTYEFKWGFRAKAEISKRHVLDFVCQIYGGMNPQSWNSQWQEVIRAEGDQTVEEEVVAMES